MNNKEYKSIIYILGFLTAIGPFSIDAYLPGFPSIAKDLQTDIEFGWRYIFVLLLIVSSLITFVISKYLPETKEADSSVSFHPLKIVKAYFSLFRNRTFLVYALASGAASALVSLFHNGTALPMSIIMMAFSAFGLGAILYDRRKLNWNKN